MIGEIISPADSERTMFSLYQKHKLLQNILVIVVIKVDYVNRMFVKTKKETVGFKIRNFTYLIKFFFAFRFLFQSTKSMD